MSDLEKLARVKLKRDDDAYKRGLREGWDQAIWVGIALCVVLYFLIQYFPD